MKNEKGGLEKGINHKEHTIGKKYVNRKLLKALQINAPQRKGN
jgi:hypothetical protein